MSYTLTSHQRAQSTAVHRRVSFFLALAGILIAGVVTGFEIMNYRLGVIFERATGAPAQAEIANFMDQSLLYRLSAAGLLIVIGLLAATAWLGQR